MKNFDDKKFPFVSIGRFLQDKSIIVPVDAAKEEIKSDICEALNKKPTIQDDAFLSTTSEEPMGETSFGPNKLTIICKPGKVKAADITDLSLFSTSENERLFVPGAKFKVKSYTVENDSHKDFPYKFNITVETV